MTTNMKARIAAYVAEQTNRHAICGFDPSRLLPNEVNPADPERWQDLTREVAEAGVYVIGDVRTGGKRGDRYRVITHDVVEIQSGALLASFTCTESGAASNDSSRESALAWARRNGRLVALPAPGGHLLA